MEISKFQNACRDFFGTSLSYLLTNLYSMRFPAPTEAPRGNELHLGCYTCWLLANLLKQNVHYQTGAVFCSSLLLKSPLNNKMTHAQTKTHWNYQPAISDTLWILTNVSITQNDTWSLSFRPWWWMGFRSMISPPRNDALYIENQLVVVTHLKNMLVKLDHFPKLRVEN